MKILKCSSCGGYTIHSTCPRCSGQADVARPPRFSPKDKYARYRRMWRAQCAEE
ncbi:MAG: RNA-protein complex protein Nop10 [Candidatus Methanofastidiosa archaeon]|nr:RNA-protein complex protein Nop10 [Candidatus Methanofastidiosa archaeon]